MGLAETNSTWMTCPAPEVDSPNESPRARIVSSASSSAALRKRAPAGARIVDAAGAHVTLLDGRGPIQISSQLVNRQDRDLEHPSVESPSGTIADPRRASKFSRRVLVPQVSSIDEETGLEIPVSPRTILKRQIAKASAMGFTIKAGSELEYYVLKDSWEEQHRAGWPVPTPFGYYNEDYLLLQGTKAEPLHRLLRNQMSEARIPIEFSKGEAAPGQHDVNIRYDEVLESADRTVIFKHGAKEIAYLNGWGITFMAKPDHRWTGSSGHLHMSVWDAKGETSLMHDPKSTAPYGMSKTMRHFLGGMMKLSRELAPFLAPNVNSYKRFAALSWAPVNVVWGRDNRTTGFRVVGHGQGLHIENRFPGGDMNAYLVYAAAVGAGLWGIEHEIEPPKEYKGNGYVATGCQRMPRALWEAILELEKSSAAVEIFGQDVLDHYLNAARVEQQQYDAVVHPWDRERYLERG